MTDQLRHYPGCAWICGGSHPAPDEFPCTCETPRLRRYKGNPVRVCRDCGGHERAEVSP
jgi:hypothetical protein